MDFLPEIIQFASKEVMAARLADVIEAELSRHDRSSIALSGGSTPALLYEVLSQRPCRWSSVTGLLVDERLVPPTDNGSNEAFINRTLRQQEAVKMSLYGMWQPGASAERLAQMLNHEIPGLALPLDVVILGMGNDGHTASWFPYANGLDEALSDNAPDVVAIKAQASAVTGNYLDRLTLSLRKVREARRIFLLISGEEKMNTFKSALLEEPVEAMPVRAILRARPDLWVCWSP
ncbi:6-phosphogluconolactonase [Parvularcula sp. IMCC14364]|uniref:6-phosphogluconolactonase n=1 Tax=Parvularcula sp. IMCC14364 TaxID=3067902 RepID=UPI00274241B1|nr:6-phosphogluconolactonase [Parvularcula sp. IMCC14364]